MLVPWQTQWLTEARYGKDHPNSPSPRHITTMQRARAMMFGS